MSEATTAKEYEPLDNIFEAREMQFLRRNDPTEETEDEEVKSPFMDQDDYIPGPGG